MLNIEKNKSLKELTTLRVGGRAEYFVVVSNREELLEAISFAKSKKLPVIVLGGGSNLLISGAVKGLVLKNEIKGIKIIEKNKSNRNWCKNNFKYL